MTFRPTVLELEPRFLADAGPVQLVLPPAPLPQQGPAGPYGPGVIYPSTADAEAGQILPPQAGGGVLGIPLPPGAIPPAGPIGSPPPKP